MSPNTSFFTTFAMLHFTSPLTANTYLDIYFKINEYLTSTINDTSINTST